MKLKNIFLILFFMLLTVPALTNAETEGSKLFDTLECYKCHGPKYQKMGPPLQEIAKVYEQLEKLINYFNGKPDPVVVPEMAKVMKDQRIILKGLSDPQRKSLAEFILKHKQ